jgi:hypothetical protein
MTRHRRPALLALAACIALVVPARAELPATLNFQQSKVPPTQLRLHRGKNGLKVNGAAPAKPAPFFRTSAGRQIEGQLEPCLRSGSGAPLLPEVMLAPRAEDSNPPQASDLCAGVG